ncbi:MAG: laccase domain-containing protein [Bacteroides cellulosilyticus]
MYDRKNQVVAAAHAGWRGGGELHMAGHTLDRMRALYGTDGKKDVIACIGPGLHRLPSFEVGEEV